MIDLCQAPLFSKGSKIFLLVLTASTCAWTAARAQAISRDEYLDYVPLEQPPLIEQTRANSDFQLFGDPKSPTFLDQDPLDGIDDPRGRTLLDLGARFGPIMVLNTTNLPMDFRRFIKQSRSFNLFVDTWSLVGENSSLLKSETVDLRSITESPCDLVPLGGRDKAGDCLLLDLLNRYNPYEPDYPALSPRTENPEERTFEIMFLDFPGDGPESWKQEYQNNFSGLLPVQYEEYLKVYLHPFITEAESVTGEAGYEFILQYYFFYPTNDGGNNHEGDWEHINVSIAPRGTGDRPLTSREVDGILAGRGLDSLVIRYVDYYFHHQVFRMDYSGPDAYAPFAEWEHQTKTMVEELHGEKNTWKAIRNYAWWDKGETIPNTHPICFVGADNKGLDQLLSAPGGTNRDSHGTYPFPGLYKDIGPSGATEQINAHFDPKQWYKENKGDISGGDMKGFGRGDAVPYVTGDRIEVLPDWECIVTPVMTDPAARADWFWMLLPVRWGYPATESPFAGIIAHAETGNLSPFGPTSQPHWNRTGSGGGSSNYLPHSFATLFPLGLQDSFVNSWGYLNLTLPVIASVPPIDIAWRLVVNPIRRLFETNDPVYFPTQTIPSRFVGLNAGISSLHFNEDTVALVLNGEPGIEQLVNLTISEPDGFVDANPVIDSATAWWWQVNFYVGKKFSTQNTLLHSRSNLAIVTTGQSGAQYRSETQLNLWEYAGSFRFDLAGKGFRPYLKIGYGWTWYRAENSTFNGKPLTTPDGAWINRPSFDSFSDILPNSWNAGAGLEVFGHRSRSPFPQGIDVSLVGEISYTGTSLGVDDWLLISGSGNPQDGLIENLSFERWTFSLGLTLGF